jgi:tetratricopeptide (TPR) repeat protein
LKPSLAEPLLIGREHQLQELYDSFNLATQEKGQTIFVSGEAGTGKTRLVQEFLKKIAKDECILLSGWCICNVDIPYFPFLEAFKSYPAFQNQIIRDENISPQTAKERTFNAITQSLLTICSEKPTVLFIDDIHWADSASLALLHYISRTITAKRAIVIATLRSEDLFSDAQGRPHPLVETLRLMRRESLLKEINLSSLSTKDSSQLIENMVGGQAQLRLTQKITSESQGNPLFIIEALSMFLENGNLIQENGKWHLSTEDFPIPYKVKDIILRRAEKIEPNYRKILDIASVIGSRFDQSLLSSVLGKDILEVVEILQKINQSSSLIVSEGNLYRFDHSMSRDALYEEVPTSLKRIYHSKIADILEKQLLEGKKTQLSDLAYHFTVAEQENKSIKYSIDAGKEALALFCGAEAIKHYNSVFSMTNGKNNYKTENIVALEGLGEGFFANARCVDSVESFRKLSEIAQDNPTKLRALSKAIRASLFLGDISTAVEIANSITFPSINELNTARFKLSRAMTASWTGKPQDSLPDFNESIGVFETAFSLTDMTDALSEVSIAYTMAGKWENALTSALRAYALIDHARNLNRQGYANFALWVIFTKCGLHQQAEETIARAFELNKRISDPIGQAWDQSFTYVMAGIQSEFKAAESMLSGLSLDNMQSFGTSTKLRFYISSLVSGKLVNFRREINAALEQSLTGVATAEETDSFMVKCINYGNVIREYSELGQTKKAKKYLYKLDSVLKDTSLSLFSFAFMMTNFSRAVYYSSTGDWDKANDYYQETLKLYHSFSPPTYIEAGIRLSYSWSLLQQGKFPEAKLQFIEAKKTKDHFQAMFNNSGLQAFAVAPLNIETGKPFELHLDLINVSRIPIKVQSIKGIDPAVLEINDPDQRDVQELNLSRNDIQPFENQKIILSVVAKRSGIIHLNLCVKYAGKDEKSKVCMLAPLILSANPAKNQPHIEQPQNKVQFDKQKTDKQTAKPFDVFLCYKKSSGKDFADHLKAGLEELGFHTFQDSKDIPMITGNEDKWDQIRDNALIESPVFILLMTPGFELSYEVVKEINMARKAGDKKFVFFRIRSMGRKFSIKLDNEIFETGKQEQISFETKEELLRLAHNILQQK